MAKTENHIYRVDPDGFMIFMSHSYRILLPVQVCFEKVRKKTAVIFISCIRMKIAAVFFFILFCIILCLRIPELVILAFCIRDQFVVGALLDHSPILEHGDLIAEFTGGQTV